jgi:hypothetical protein
VFECAAKLLEQETTHHLDPEHRCKPVDMLEPLKLKRWMTLQSSGKKMNIYRNIIEYKTQIKGKGKYITDRPRSKVVKHNWKE